MPDNAGPACVRCDERVDDVCSGCDSCDCVCICMICDSCDARCETACENCGRCEDCCHCSHCEALGHACESVCEHCGCCPTHCDCIICYSCERECDEEQCSDCELCHACCTCGNDGDDDPWRPVRLLSQPKKPRFHKGGPCRQNPSARFIACELEIATARHGDDVNDAVGKWEGSIVTDGSLPSTGFEICTAPASGSAFVDQIEDVAKALAAQQARVDRSCGYHVHVDARDLTYWDVRRLILLYRQIEPALFSCVPKSRRENNTYCEPCGERYALGLKDAHKGTRGRIVEKVYPSLELTTGPRRKQILDKVTKEKYNPARYAALNLHSWFYRGTVECRLAAGTTAATKIIMWAVLWAGILDATKRMKEAEIDRLPTDSFVALSAVAPTHEVREWLKSRRNNFTDE